MEDSRVLHFWDEKKKVGRYFAGKDPDTDNPEVVWDTYYLYGPDAEWTTKPAPLISTGATVRNEAGELKNRLLPLLK